MLDAGLLAIHQVSLLEQWSFTDAVVGLARHGVHATAVWRDKLAAVGTREAARILRDNDMTVTALGPGGMLTQRGRLDFQAALDDNRRLLDEAAEIGARSILFIAGGLEGGEKDIAFARARALEGLSLLLPEAKKAEIKVALEPLHPMVCALRSVLTTLGEANDWCDRLGAGIELGIAIDTYAVWWDPHLEREIRRAGKRICGFHVSDWLADTVDIRLDRGMMGDGLIDIPGIRRMVEATGYAGHREVEIFSERNWWRKDPDDVVRIIKERYQTAV